MLRTTTKVSFLFVVCLTSIVSGADMGTAFTYQGSLENGSGPVTDTCNFRFGLWDSSAGGNPRGNSPQTIAGVEVTGGVFVVEALDFGWRAIDGTARWMAIEVQCTGDPGFTLLSPRVRISPAPHALALPGLFTQENGGTPNIIGGSVYNSLNLTGVVGATISGGGDSGFQHLVTDNYGTIGGGLGNQAGNQSGTLDDARAATVGGGLANIASGIYSSVAGGVDNNAVGYASTISGGFENTATGNTATVPGGGANSANGNYSLAAGFRAKANHNGTFVWSDNFGDDFISSGVDQFLIRARGGLRLASWTGVPQFQAVSAQDSAFAVNLAMQPLGGNVGIGTSSPNFQLSLGSTLSHTKIALYETSPSNHYGLGVVAGQMSFHLNGSLAKYAFYDSSALTNEVFTVTGTGRVGINDNAPSVALDVVGDIHYTGTITDVSDRRLKENINPLRNALEKVDQLHGVYFTMKDRPETTEVGLIAQDVQEVLPEAVRVVDPEEGILGVSYPSIIPLLVEATKEMQGNISASDREISKLKSEISSLQSEMEQMRALVGRLTAMNEGGQ